MKNFEQEIKDIKEKYNASVIDKAKAEERKSNFLTQKAEIEKQCASIGIAPENLQAERDNKLNQLQEAINSCKAKLGINKQVEDEDTPF